MRNILCIASLLFFITLHGYCLPFQDFNNKEWMTCYFHYLCDLNDTQRMYQVLEGSGDQIMKKFGELMHEVFGVEGPTSLEQFVTYKTIECSHAEDKRRALFNEFISSILDYSLVSCVNPFSKVCREIDDGVMRASAYLKKITESEECGKKEDAVKKPAVRNIFG